MLTKEEIAKLERELHIARQKVFEDESAITEIERIKELLKPSWEKRVNENIASRNENYFM